MKPFSGDYISSGRFHADCARDRAFEQRRLAHHLLRVGQPRTARQWLRKAMRSWALFRYYKERIS